MRILSQDGTIDVPYENSMVFRNDEYILYLICGSDAGKVVGRLLARYSTPEKAQKAMKMLRESYNNYVFAINLFSGEMLKSYANSHSKEEFNELAYPYFRFPADEDVEE